jgi:ubiquinone/menaquinone biosynthesis C-methylase UbiE
LEIGCGSGGVLQEVLTFGATPERLWGCDLLSKRAGQARQVLPEKVSLTCADGQSLPYPAHNFDLLLQYTVFSSILDQSIKANLAAEMLRVTKPGGMILWYDFWLNPTNPQTRGVRPAEIRRLFPGCRFTFERITLAPPIARRLVPVSWGLCLFLESLKIFNTHYLAAIRPAG